MSALHAFCEYKASSSTGTPTLTLKIAALMLSQRRAYDMGSDRLVHIAGSALHQTVSTALLMRTRTILSYHDSFITLWRNTDKHVLPGRLRLKAWT
jgi:hypothetical protein